MTEAPSDAPGRVDERRWGLGDVAAGWLGGQALAIVVYSVLQGATGRTADEMDDLPLVLMFVPQLGLWTGLLGVPLLVTRLKGRGPREDLGLEARPADSWRGGWVGIALQLAVIPLLYWPLLELLDRNSDDLEGPARDLVDQVHGFWAVLLLVAWVGIVGPIIEEIFFRGLLQGALRKRGLSPAWTIGLTGVLFSASHLQGIQLPALAIFGCVAAFLVHRSGRLGPAIACHITFNMVTVIALLASR